jgi:hypothetical protein
MRRRSPHIVGCKRGTRASCTAVSHASFIMGSRAAAWVGRGSTSGQTAVPVPRNCARSCVPPARAARYSAIEAYSCKSHVRAAKGQSAAAPPRSAMKLAPSHANCPSRTKPTKRSVVRHSKIGSPMTLWVISRHHAILRPCPLCPRKQTLLGAIGMSAWCHKRTHAAQQENALRELSHWQLTGHVDSSRTTIMLSELSRRSFEATTE